MFVAAFLLFLLCQSSAEPDKVVYRCSNKNATQKSMTFTPAADGVSGRYTAELCTLRNPRVSSWTIDLSYYDNIAHCGPSDRPWRPDHQHSANTLDINDPTNCTHVCYAMNFDLIFSTCYGIKSTFKVGKSNGAPYDSYHNITNNHTFEEFSRKNARVSIYNHEDDVTLHWHLGIPPTDFKVVICPKEPNQCKHTDVTRNCSVQATQVECTLAPPHGLYHAMLVHEAPWTAGVFHNLTYVTINFNYTQLQPPQLWSSDMRVWWACGGALLLTCALLTGTALRRAASVRDYHKRVLDSWRRSREVEASRSSAPDSRGVLLLHAREGEHGQRAVAALRDLLHAATAGQVYDIFSPEVTALSASAPASWVREMLLRDDIKVLVVQSPAIAALYQAQLCERDAGLRLQEPLLGRRAMYRAPQFGDQLLQLALRLIAENADAHHDYHKYYLTTYSGLHTEVLPGVVPYRRYELPGAAAALLADLAERPDHLPPLPHPPHLPPLPHPPHLPPLPHPPHPPHLPHPALGAFSEAARSLLQHVRDHPDYLMDELVLM